MKQILLSFIFIISAASLFAQSQRTVLMEEFTQASCPPCEATTPALNALMIANEEKVVQIRYQTSWPGVDPMNADNPAEVQTRVDYYGVTGVPNFNFDGVTNGAAVPTQGQLDDAHAADAPVLVEVSHELAADLQSMSVTVKVINEGTTDYSMGNDKLRVALVEEVINWPFRPGSTSIQDFEFVMKTFFTTPAGMDMPDVAAGETWEMTWDGLELPAVVYNYNLLAVTAFIQNDTGRGVINAGASHAVALSGYPDYAVENVSVGDDGLCDYAFAPSAIVNNVGTTAASGAVVNFLVDGNIVETITVAEEIAGGSSTQVDFTPLDLGAGTNAVTFVVEGGAAQDIALLNNFSTAVTFPKAALPAGDLERDFEGQTAGEAPANTILDTPTTTFVLNADALQLATPIGGYGLSANSVRINYYQWTNDGSLPLSGSMAIAEQIEITDLVNTLTFDWAFTTWGGSNDGLAVEVSNDCGETYTELWGLSGASLATAPELNQNQEAFAPDASEWRSADIDLAAYMGETVLVRFRFDTGWGDMMYLDNISIQGVSSLDELDTNESFDVYPNPVSDVLNLDMNITETANVSVRVLNVLGELVMTEQLGSVYGRQIEQLNVADLQAGSYLLHINVGDKEVVRRVSIVD